MCIGMYTWMKFCKETKDIGYSGAGGTGSSNPLYMSAEK